MSSCQYRESDDGGNIWILGLGVERSSEDTLPFTSLNPKPGLGGSVSLCVDFLKDEVDLTTCRDNPTLKTTSRAIRNPLFSSLWG